MKMVSLVTLKHIQDKIRLAFYVFILFFLEVCILFLEELMVEGHIAIQKGWLATIKFASTLVIWLAGILLYLIILRGVSISMYKYILS